MFQLPVICADVFHSTLDHEASLFLSHRSLFWVTQFGSFYNAKHFGLTVSEVVLRKQTLTRIP